MRSFTDARAEEFYDREGMTFLAWHGELERFSLIGWQRNCSMPHCARCGMDNADMTAMSCQHSDDIVGML